MKNLNNLSRSEVAKLHGYLFLPYVPGLTKREAEILKSLGVLSAYERGEWKKVLLSVRKCLKGLRDPGLEVKLSEEIVMSLARRFPLLPHTKIEEPCVLCEKYITRSSDISPSHCRDCPLAKWELEDTFGCTVWLEAITGIDYTEVPGLHIGKEKILAFTEKAKAWIESVRILGEDFIKVVSANQLDLFIY